MFSSALTAAVFVAMLIVFTAGASHSLMAQGASNSVDSNVGPGHQEDEWSWDRDDWRVYGGNLHNTHSARFEHRISRRNAAQLSVKWTFITGGDVSATPTIEDDALYVPDAAGNLFKIDRENGTAIWKTRMSDYTGNPMSFSRNSPAIADDAIIVGDQASGTVVAVDKHSGKLLWKTLVDPHPAAIITNSPVVFEGRIYVGVSSKEEGFALIPGYQLSFRGSVRALDLRTGAVLWSTFTVPQGYTGGALWGSNFVVDQRRDSLYVTTGNNYSVPDDVSSCLQTALTVAAELACLSPQDYVDSVLSLSLKDGEVKWDRRLQGADAFTVSCLIQPNQGVPCPNPEGPDFDFGSGPNFFRIVNKYGAFDVLGAGQKSGVYWALDPDDGRVLWATHVGPGGGFGGIQWGSATDGRRIYVAISNSFHIPYTLAPAHKITATAGSWAALDPVSGAILWQVPASGQDPVNPALAATAPGQVSAANGVVYAGSMSGDMVALSAATGDLLWKFASGGSVVCGPSIVQGVVYWGSGYLNFGFGKSNNKLYAFTVPRE
jgi:polyvinyl alcohol dehydrogenase (cytochrome)